MADALADKQLLIDALRDKGTDVTNERAIKCPFHDDTKPSAYIKWYASASRWRFVCQADSCRTYEDVFGIRAKINSRSSGDEMYAMRDASKLSTSSPRHDTSFFPTRERITPKARPAPASATVIRRQTLDQAMPRMIRSVSSTMTHKTKGKPTSVVAGLVVPYVHFDSSPQFVEQRFDVKYADGSTDKTVRPFTDGEWKAPVGPRRLFRLPEIESSGPVLVTEGAKCGIIAKLDEIMPWTAWSGGACAVSHSDWSPLAGREVWFWPDVGGEAVADQLVPILQGLTPPARISIIRGHGLAEDGDDVEQWREGRGVDETPEALRAAIAEMADLVSPTTATPEPVSVKAKPAQSLAKGIALKAFASFDRLKNTEYLWYERIPLGALSMIAADPGVGKSSMFYDLIARWSRGDSMPDGSRLAPIDILILSAEDAADDSAGPKLLAAGADFAKIRSWPEPFDVHRHAELLEDTLIANPAIKLVMIEPIAEQVRGNSNDVIDVSKAMGRIQDIAQRRNIAIVGIHHFNKSSATSFAQKMLGSVAFYGKSRVAWGIHKPRASPDRRVLAIGKSNCRVSDVSLQFSIERCEVDGPNGTLLTTRIVWHSDRVTQSMDDLLREDNADSATPMKAWDWLTKYLADGPKLMKDVEEAGAAEGSWSSDQLDYARKKIGADSKRVPGGMNTPWFWRAKGDTRVPAPSVSDDILPFVMKPAA